MPQLRRQALKPSLAPRFAPSFHPLRPRPGQPRVLQPLLLIRRGFAASLLVLFLVLGWPATAGAAEVLQVNGPDRLIIGDRNRSSVVLLACMAVAPGSEAQAQQWLRQRLPRRSRVNLRPIGERENHLLVRVSPVDAPEIGDLSDGLIGAGLATPLPCS